MKFRIIFITHVLAWTSLLVNNLSVLWQLILHRYKSLVQQTSFLNDEFTHFVYNCFLRIFEYPLVAFHPGVDIEFPVCACVVLAIGWVGYGDVIPQALYRLTVFVIRHGRLQPVGLVQNISWVVAHLDFTSENRHTRDRV